MADTKQAAVKRKDDDSPVCLADIQHEGSELICRIRDGEAMNDRVAERFGRTVLEVTPEPDE